MQVALKNARNVPLVSSDNVWSASNPWVGYAPLQAPPCLPIRRQL